MSQQSPVPGWYQDPQQTSLERYWDGQQWTPYTQPSQPAAGGGAGAWQRWRGLRRRTKALSIGAVVVALIALTPHGAAHPDHPSAGPHTSATPSPTPTPTPEVPAPTKSKPERATVPGVRAMSLAEARGRLHKADLSYRVVKQYSWKPAGQVLTQRLPAGSKVQLGRVITLVVAKAMPRVPHVAGSGVKGGTAVLRSAGFTVSVVHEVVTSGASGVILRTSPVSGTQRAPGSNIQVVVSNLVRPVAAPPPAAPASNCTPGYKPCLTPASDYDCAGGSGDGPAYASGPIYVSGSDPYGLDADGDGVACES